MSKGKSNATMQSEIFIVLMIVMVLLFIITSFYISKLKEHQQPPLIIGRICFTFVHSIIVSGPV